MEQDVRKRSGNTFIFVVAGMLVVASEELLPPAEHLVSKVAAVITSLGLICVLMLASSKTSDITSTQYILNSTTNVALEKNKGNEKHIMLF